MEEINNLENLSKKVATQLFDAISVTDILYNMTNGERHNCFLIDTLHSKIKQSFDDIEIMRHIISDND